MSRKIVRESEKKSGWDLAIAEGQAQLKEWKAKVARLVAAIETCREAKKNGLPWSGQTARQD
jgi:hypothetical protein